ncbi:DUF3618 domain-containing protein [Bradyrhizobium sp. USDA 4473]
MTHSEQLERETEEQRTQLANTLDELRACMTPGHVVDQLADRVSEGAAAAFTRNLRDQAVNNPLPIMIMGASLAWMMLGSRTGSAAGPMRRTAGRMRDAAGDATESVRTVADRASDGAAEKSGEWSNKVSTARSEVADSLASAADQTKKAANDTGRNMRDAAGSMVESARETAAQTRENIRDTAASMTDSMQRTVSEGYEAIADSGRRTASSISDSTKAAGQRTLQTGNSLVEFCREQPLLLTGIGIAVGALMGALLPATGVEDRMMGETSDQMKEQARDFASEQYDSAKKVGERALDAAQDEATKQAQKADASSGEVAAHGAKSDQATLVPDESQTSEGEWQGQPWKPENAPV